MFYDFVEIGTSDFDTLIQQAASTATDVQGLSIDPVADYLDRLPSPNGCTKLNAAISDKEGEVAVFFVRPELIPELGLPAWVRGCNSIAQPHPAVARLVNARQIDPGIVVESKVPMYRLETVLRMFRISGVFFLKVDTEGHDEVILGDFFDSVDPCRYPHRLLFESNVLCDNDRVHKLIARLILTGYDIVRCETGGGATDTLLRLNISRLPNRTRFTSEIAGYYLAGYPSAYDFKRPPHRNTLEDAQRYCLATHQGGVTYQYGRYEVREGRYLGEQKTVPEARSWILM